MTAKQITRELRRLAREEIRGAKQCSEFFTNPEWAQASQILAKSLRNREREEREKLDCHVLTPPPF